MRMFAFYVIFKINQVAALFNKTLLDSKPKHVKENFSKVPNNYLISLTGELDLLKTKIQDCAKFEENM